jgi:hypothetical protein
MHYYTLANALLAWSYCPKAPKYTSRLLCRPWFGCLEQQTQPRHMSLTCRQMHLMRPTPHLQQTHCGPRAWAATQQQQQQQLAPSDARLLLLLLKLALLLLRLLLRLLLLLPRGLLCCLCCPVKAGPQGSC